VAASAPSVSSIPFFIERKRRTKKGGKKEKEEIKEGQNPLELLLDLHLTIIGGGEEARGRGGGEEGREGEKESSTLPSTPSNSPSSAIPHTENGKRG